ncbi:tyrosine-type recombinase/integrase [candidate division CSSED10-310 bacterium]|uniref:Tyrosine-type recombinase/integrase n=1 Tax=candidate division CSSED10-310 bacterium TaxID=2855610 RepID=A0ABV6Z3W3_UNCC1
MTTKNPEILAPEKFPEKREKYGSLIKIPERIERNITPSVITESGEKGQKRFWEFFTVTIRNKNTRIAYLTAAHQFFDWCLERGFKLETILPMDVALYIETHPGSIPTIKQHLAALRMLFDWLVIGHVIEFNPASSVRSPKYSYPKGKTPVLTAKQTRKFLDSIDTSHLVGLRDRALIGLMVFSFARVSAAIKMKIKDYYHQGDDSFFRLHEKGGKYNVVPAHITAQIYLDEYLKAAGIADDKKAPLFRMSRSPRNKTKLSYDPMNRNAVLKMIKRRAKEAGFPEINCHSFRGTGITAYLKGGGTIEKAAFIAGHSSTRTTQLYDRTKNEISQEEISRIVI